MIEYILKESEIDTLILEVKKQIIQFQTPLILLTGEMGAGKTTFTRNLVQSYDFNQKPNSPTYNLVNEYKLEKFSIFHFDLYRLKSEMEIAELGFEDIWQNEFCIIEWWKIAENFLPKSRIEIQFFHETENSRKIKIDSIF